MKWIVLALMVPFFAKAATENIRTDYYRFQMRVKAPIVVGNEQSQGRRVYKWQTFRGTLTLTHTLDRPSKPKISIRDLVNHSWRVQGQKVAYQCTIDDSLVLSRVNLVGNNRTGVFTTPSVVFFLVAEPSYNMGPNDPDNSLFITLAGSGTTKLINRTGWYWTGSSSIYVGREYRIIHRLTGYLAGTLGCGCTAYGHTSPTRVVGPYGPLDAVDDVASATGNWTARYQRSVHGVVQIDDETD